MQYFSFFTSLYCFVFLCYRDSVLLYTTLYYLLCFPVHYKYNYSEYYTARICMYLLNCDAQVRATDPLFSQYQSWRISLLPSLPGTVGSPPWPLAFLCDLPHGPFLCDLPIIPWPCLVHPCLQWYLLFWLSRAWINYGTVPRCHFDVIPQGTEYYSSVHLAVQIKLHTRSPSVKQILGSSKLGVTTVQGWVRAVLRGLLNYLDLIWIWMQYLYRVFPKSWHHYFLKRCSEIFWEKKLLFEMFQYT